MRMAVAFLPPHMRQLMNLLASSEPYTASGTRDSALAVRLPIGARSIASGGAPPAGSVERRRGKDADTGVRADAADGAVGVEGQVVDLPAVGAGDGDRDDRRLLFIDPLALRRDAQGGLAAVTGEI